MTWVKLDDQFFSHPKAVRAGRNARILYVAALCWCKSHLTDGIIPKTALPMLAAQADVPGKTSAASLVSVGLWHDEGDHWRVNDWPDYQESADVERERKRKKAERQKRWLEKLRKERETASETQDETRLQTHHEAGQWPLPDTDTDTDTDTSLDIEIPTTTKSVDAKSGGGGALDLNHHRRRARIVQRATDRQIRNTPEVHNMPALRTKITRRLQALYDTWDPVLIATLSDADLEDCLVTEEAQPVPAPEYEPPPPPPPGFCSACGNTGVYRYGPADYQSEPCPYGPHTETGTGA